MPSYAQSTIREDIDNPEDEKKIKLPKKRGIDEKTEKSMPDGTKGPKFSKKQMNQEMNRRNASRYGNMTDY